MTGKGIYVLCALVLVSGLPLAVLCVALLGTALSQQAPQSPPAAAACTDQSPRDLTPASQQDGGLNNYDFVALVPLISVPPGNVGSPPKIITYTRLTYGGKVFYNGTLYLCDQHYHFPVENIQGCEGETPDVQMPEKHLGLGQRIEVHTVYAAGVNQACVQGGLDDHLDCCTAGPFVVRAFSAQLVEGSDEQPLVDPAGEGPRAEWTGSTTGAPKPGENGCKPAPVQWTFRLGCSFTVTENQLKGLGPHAPREVQTADRLSSDLTLVGSQTEVDQIPCRKAHISGDLPEPQAQAACQQKCKDPFSRFAGFYQGAHGMQDSSVCMCCPEVRSMAP